MAVTLKALARLAGVHPSTVARVLNGDPQQRVSDEVRGRIVALAEQHGYQPNHLARALRLKRSRVIGTIIPDIANPFSVILANTDDQPAREQRSLDMLRGRQVDGLILATARHHDPAIQALAAEGVPFVLVNRHTDPLLAPAVVPDDYNGAVAAVEHLIALGHRRIAHIAGDDDISTGHKRRLGYIDALARHGLRADPDLVVTGSFREAGGDEAMRALLALPRPPTAVFAVNDLAAIGALRALHEAGLQVPRDMSLVGFNDLPMVAQTSPRLTTMHVPLRDMGVAAAERLLAVLAGRETGRTMVAMPVELVCRDSTGPLRSRHRAAGGI